MEEIKVKKAKLYEEDGCYYIDVTYIYENDRVIKEVHFPKVPMPITEWTGDVNKEIIRRPYSDICFGSTKYSIKLGELLMPLEPINGIAYSEKVIEEKTQEMTIEEIEKRLGYKIKVVAKK